MRQGQGRWSRLSKTVLKRSDLTEKFQFRAFHTEAETEKTLHRIPKKESLYSEVYMYAVLVMADTVTTFVHKTRIPKTYET